ncbi:MAG: FtsX-like permease family protein [Cyclobacteriaceae bacterium]
MKRFFKTLYRNIKKNPLNSAINVFGLTLGFSCIITITIWIQNELSYDTFHENSDKIYRVHRYFYNPDGSENLHLSNVAPPVAPMLEKELKEIESIARVKHTGFTFSRENKLTREDEVCFAEPEILDIFHFEGLPNDDYLLEDPLTMIISDEQAMKYFNRLDVIGEVISFTSGDGQRRDLKISGVFKKWNQNSHFHPEFLISFITFESFAGEEEMKSWGSNNYETFALIPHLPSDIDTQLDNIIDEYLEDGTSWTKIRIEALTDIHFNWHSNKTYIYVLASISLLILILGSINYLNLNMAMYSQRLEEIKVRKIMGASPKMLIAQLIAESVLFCLTALVFATGIVYLVLPEFNNILGSPLQFSLMENIPMVAGFILLTILTGVLSVFYPAMVLSSFNPTASKANQGFTLGKSSFRTGLVVFQFFVSIALITSFLIVYKQLSYIQHKELGLNKENILVIPSTPQLIEKLDVFRQELTANPNILSVSGSKRVPSDGLWDNSGAEIESNGEVSPIEFRLPNVRVDEHFLSTYGIPLIAGRNFNETDGESSGYLINAQAARQIGWESAEEAIGQVITYGGHRGNVIGVIGDFHYESLHVPISPIILNKDPSSYNRVSIRVSPFNRQQTIELIEANWQQYNIPNYSFYYEYIDESYDKLYRSEQNIKIILTYFMVIAISIAILGLIALSLFMIQRRVKEIGVRKVNGANISELMVMLNKDFVKWVIIAFVMATPLAWYAMSRWLENFAYKTELSWWVFALAGLMALGVALLTVSMQSWKAATRNPVEALRYE